MNLPTVSSALLRIQANVDNPDSQQTVPPDHQSELVCI